MEYRIKVAGIWLLRCVESAILLYIVMLKLDAQLTVFDDARSDVFRYRSRAKILSRASWVISYRTSRILRFLFPKDKLVSFDIEITHKFAVSCHINARFEIKIERRRERGGERRRREREAVSIKYRKICIQINNVSYTNLLCFT